MLILKISTLSTHVIWLKISRKIGFLMGFLKIGNDKVSKAFWDGQG